MDIFTNFGMPALAIVIAGGLVWATTQVCKAAIRKHKEKYLAYSAIGALFVAALVVLTMGPWTWLMFAWIAFGGWLSANLGHKFYARYFKKLIESKID